ncbi:MAG: hypothetical protein U1C56_01625, partial [Candidatus Curtissbacteria bacterium]|nr:hypothetical protein [Candidatus Curtissbacteria bacterium]
MKWLWGNLAGLWLLVSWAGWLYISYHFGVRISSETGDFWAPARLVPFWFLASFLYWSLSIWVGVFVLEIEERARGL